MQVHFRWPNFLEWRRQTLESSAYTQRRVHQAGCLGTRGTWRSGMIGHKSPSRYSNRSSTICTLLALAVAVHVFRNYTTMTRDCSMLYSTGVCCQQWVTEHILIENWYKPDRFHSHSARLAWKIPFKSFRTWSFPSIYAAAAAATPAIATETIRPANRQQINT